MRYAGWTSPSSPPPRPTTTAVRCSAHSAFRSVAKDKAQDRYGQEGTRQQAAGRTQVQGARLYPLSSLRPSAVGVSRLRVVPDLSARDGPRRGNPGYDEVVLVRGLQL